MKYNWILLIAILFASCQKQAETKVNIIVKTDVPIEVVVYDNMRDHSVELVDGKGTYTFKGNTPRYIHIGTGEYWQLYFIMPGHELTHEIALEHDENKRIIGVDMSPNKPPYDKLQTSLLKYNNPAQAVTSNDFLVNDVEFTKMVKTSIKNYTENLETLDLPEEFKKNEKQRIKWLLLATIADHPNGYTYLNKVDPETYEMSGEIKQFLKDQMNTDDDISVVKRDVAMYLRKYFQAVEKGDFKEYARAMKWQVDELSRVVENKDIREQFIYSWLYLHIEVVKGKVDKETIALFNEVQDDELRSDLFATLKRYEDVAEGEKAPNWTFYDAEGKAVSLKDLRGKLVLIDVWASWCQPCIQSLPSLMKLEDEYALKPIHFVTISIDKDAEAWKEKSKELGLKGINLLCTDINKFKEDYNIVGIPATILIDEEGKIIEPNAPRPGEVELQMLINKNLK